MMPDIPPDKSTKLPSHSCISDEAGALKSAFIALRKIKLDFVQGIEKTGHRGSQGEPEGPIVPRQQVNEKSVTVLDIRRLQDLGALPQTPHSPP
jgi:hypothetical protein